MKIRNTVMIALVSITLLSVTNLFGVHIAGLSVLLGLICFFVINRLEKLPRLEKGLNLRTVGNDLRIPKIWFWILMPSLMNLFTIFLSKLILPEYMSHVMARSSAILTTDKLSTLVLQVAVLALGEEIAWRGFYQKRLKSFIPIVPAIVISSLFFALAHLSTGSPVIVLYDLFFVFANSILYGIVFEKTNNAWVSTIAHICANLIALGIMFFI